MNEKMHNALLKWRTPIFFILLICSVTFTYRNHFQNAFHFDDSHTVENNLFIRSINNIPLFFKDATTFSTIPINQQYRPIVSSSLALDYWMGNGFDLFYFHLSSFILFLLQGILMFYFMSKIFNLAYPGKWNFYVAAIAVAWYLLHPANAETINYVIARSDLQSTFFVILSFVLYQYSPLSKKTYLYLLPIAIGGLAKPTAVMFAPLFFFYVLLFEYQLSIPAFFKKENRHLMLPILKSIIPAFIFCGIIYAITEKMKPDTFYVGDISRWQYLMTQPFVILHYFITLFLPLELSADTDWALLESPWDIRLLVGSAFIFAMLFIAYKTSKIAKWRPVSFGILWFFIALIPTSSIIPLTEVLNDHRIFYPYVGLVISVCWSLCILFENLTKNIVEIKQYERGLMVVVFLVLCGYSYGTTQRNEVWKSDSTLWQDVTIKSPKNARGLMNYGLTFLRANNYKEADKYFTMSYNMKSWYWAVNTNLGVVKAFLHDDVKAEFHFKKALEIGPSFPTPYYHYAKFLNSRSHTAEAINLLKRSLEIMPGYIYSRSLLCSIYQNTKQWDKLGELAQKTLEIVPGDAEATRFLVASRLRKSETDMQEDEILKAPTAEKYLDLSLTYYNQNEFEKCIIACEKALQIKPNFAEAYNNICSANNILGNYDAAIIAGQKATQMDPNNQLAKNNLTDAFNRKSKGTKLQNLIQQNPTVDNYINLSLEYFNMKQYRQCIEVAEKILQKGPNDAAYNNICAAYNMLSEWDKAIEAGEKGLKINPNNQLLKNNLHASYEGAKAFK